ncbi:hypothetical protein HaLaN_13979 [Haematococcus lacustris]|uniref:Uncharacterized protein n=1 Tax=Haematococcus lacustris TaxID=44745 RepID=A0A699Z7C0_HAELA|nr:hypothetical protein HaLaN_13979 [Haematococcus lacustris]
MLAFLLPTGRSFLLVLDAASWQEARLQQLQRRLGGEQQVLLAG